MRTVKVYRLDASEATRVGTDWDYESEEVNGPGWYWDSWVDGREITVADGPYSTKRIAEFAAGVRP